MTVYAYFTPEWLEESAKLYAADPKYEQEFATITPKATKYVFRVKSEPAWGIESDILFGAVVERGKLLQLDFINEAEAKKDVEFILGATPQEWKRLLRKEIKFITAVMLKKIAVEYGEFGSLLKIAPHGDTFVNALTQVRLQFPDEMSPEELAQYKAHVKAFREKKGV